MNYDTIFAQYYTAYRAEATIPDVTDDEYTIGMRFANDAIRRWRGFDNTYWRELFTTSVANSTGGVITTTANDATYAAPTAMQEPGGFVRLLNSNGTVNKNIPIINPNEAQFRSQEANVAYFTGDPSNGFTLNFNNAPDTSGLTILYDYYKTPTLITTGTSKPEMSDPNFIVNYMLASRFRASRNPYYGAAKRDAENMLGQMKMANDSGSWANPWQVADNSGTVWGNSQNGGW